MYHNLRRLSTNFFCNPFIFTYCTNLLTYPPQILCTIFICHFAQNFCKNGPTFCAPCPKVSSTGTSERTSAQPSSECVPDLPQGHTSYVTLVRILPYTLRMSPSYVGRMLPLYVAPKSALVLVYYPYTSGVCHTCTSGALLLTTRPLTAPRHIPTTGQKKRSVDLRGHTLLRRCRHRRTPHRCSHAARTDTPSCRCRNTPAGRAFLGWV